MRLDGKTALVTGGTTGIGFATARRFLDEGAERVVVTGQDEARVAEAARALGNRAAPLRADLRRMEDIEAMGRAAAEALGGRLDVLFANAGVGGFAPFGAVPEAFFDEQFDVNVKGLFFSVQALLPLLGPGSSVILNASSVAAKGLAGAHVYNATKAAVRSFARSLAAELGPRGIRVNAVSPGLVPTPFAGRAGLPPEAFEGFAAGVVAQTPLGRTGTVEEIAAAAAFLASAEAGFMTGADLLADGGWASV